MNQKNDIIKSIIVLTVICLVVSAALAVVNRFTAPVSAANAEARNVAARRELIPDAERFDGIADMNLPEGVVDASFAYDAANELVGYAFTVKSQGFGGAITVICAIDTEGRVIRTKALDLSGETATLGGKTANPAYADQYIGKNSELSGVEAISGATITSSAYKDCVQKSFQSYSILNGGVTFAPTEAPEASEESTENDEIEEEAGA